ncbi:MAG: phosphotransacetylase family protein [Chloroflexota bacterium]
MKSLYVTSIEAFSGKTAVCLALGLRFQADGHAVGYIKPLSLQPYRLGGKVVDEDAVFVKRVLGLEADLSTLSPVVVTKEVFRACLRGTKQNDLMEKLVAAKNEIGKGKDILLLEGGGTLREGYVVGLPTPVVAKELGSVIIVVIKYTDDIGVVDNALTSRVRLGDALGGVLINRVPAEAMKFLKEEIVPCLEDRGIPVLCILPEKRELAALTVEELIQVLDAEVLTTSYDPAAMVETLTVGAMTAESALSRMRQYGNKAVITGGDRTDIQLAALETSTTCLILTGYLHPSPLIVKQAEEFGVSILLVHDNTMETIETIERVYGKTRLGQTAKLEKFRTLLEEHMDFKRLYQIISMNPA